MEKMRTINMDKNEYWSRNEERRKDEGSERSDLGEEADEEQGGMAVRGERRSRGEEKEGRKDEGEVKGEEKDVEGRTKKEGRS